MLFDSPEFIFIFFPFVLFSYFFLLRKLPGAFSKLWLAAASIFFYAYLNPKQLAVLLGSIMVNFAAAKYFLTPKNNAGWHARTALVLGIAFNCGLLGYFKYADFFIANLNQLAAWKISLLNTALPLGISFFTFSQIAYLVDSYRQKIAAHSFLEYVLFVTYFPKLLAGPIVRFNEMMPQFGDAAVRTFNHGNFSSGTYLVFIGLFKKIVLADIFARWATNGFDNSSVLTFFEAWATSLSYSFQLYFDFSGYTDMALGIALAMNIRLPINFDSPYKALNIQDFWRRWHITLSRFIKDFVYIPLGGSRISEARTIANLLTTFLVCGLWHGAGWTFIFWGFLHGLGLVVQRSWKKFNIALPAFFAWFLTFNFVNVAWVFFRARSFDDAAKVLKGMAGASGFVLPEQLLAPLPKICRHFISGSASPVRYLADSTVMGVVEMFLIFVVACVFVFVCKNTNHMSELQKKAAFACTLAFTVQGLFFNLAPSQFIYFRF